MITLLLALVLGGLAAFSASNWLERKASGEPVATRTVVVAKKALSFGAQLTADDLAEIPWGAAEIPPGTFSKREDLLKDGRRAVLRPFVQNEPIFEWKITGPGQRASLSALIENGMRAVTVRVDDVRGVAGFILPGERIDIVLVQGAREESASDIILQNVRVLAVDQLANEKQESPQLARAVTVEVNTEQAQKLILASEVGRLSLILRQAGNSTAEHNRRVTAADLTVIEVPQSRDAPSAPSNVASIAVTRDAKRDVYSVNKEP
ncbi:MAG: Flp pilus assembly protein CpaB [Beijerinckiaceae bacterium]|nr:Flp pilus assembly protein CpaB [Beijerinckiaceae bacterium]